jgi:hypothetical protein
VLGAGSDRRGQDVAIIEIGKLKALNERFVSFDPAFRKGLAHGLDLRVDAGLKLWLQLEQIVAPFTNDVL